ncbi:MAG: cytochrome c oxidase assembly protein [Chloroflexota bacterium]
MHVPALPVLHTGAYPPTGFLSSDWAVDPTVVLAVIGMLAAYTYLTGPKARATGRPPASRKQRACFIAGVLILFVALAPPLDDWADWYLLSAHMFQHMLLMFGTAPLLLLGLPGWIFEPVVQRPLWNRVGASLTHPVTAFVVSNILITVWHLPGPYDAALRNELVHAVQHGSFLVAALLGWWPVFGPVSNWSRLSLPLQCVYLFVESIPGGIVGAFVSLAEPGIYHFYVTAPRLWGISLAADQEFAGVMMWVGGSIIYLLIFTALFFRWAAREDAKETGTQPRMRQQEVAPSDGERPDTLRVSAVTRG